jgi:hypothetical protein
MKRATKVKSLVVTMAAGLALLAVPAMAEHKDTAAATEEHCAHSPRQVVEAFIPLF